MRFLQKFASLTSAGSSFAGQKRISLTVAIILSAFLLMPSGTPDALFAQTGPETSGPAAAALQHAIAVDGDNAVVGVQWANGFKGAAYVLKRNAGAWVLHQELAPQDLGRFDHFGASVWIRGGEIIVDAPWHNLLEGASFVFERDGDRWTERRKIDIAEAGELAAKSPGVSTTNVSPDERLLLTNIIAPQAGPAPITRSSAQLDSVEWVSATDSTIEDRVRIQWQSTGLDAIVYKIKRDGDPLALVSSNETSCEDASAILDSTHNYCVIVKDMGGEESSPTCDDGTRVLFPPQAVSASDGEYTDKVRITWVDMSSINTGYSIRRSTEIDPTGMEIGTAGPNATLFDDTTSINPDSMYLYEVVATITGGYESVAKSDSGWIGMIKPPLNVLASDGQYLDFVRITWQGQAPDTAGYRVYRDSTLIKTFTSNVTAYDDTSAVFGDTCTYCVAALSEETISGILSHRRSLMGGPGDDESARVCDDGSIGLTAPGGVSSSDSTYDDRIRVTWTDRTNFEDGYEITRDAEVIDTTRANIELYDDFDADPDITYTYFVRAVNDLGGVSNSGSDDGYRSIVLAPVDVQASDGTFEDHVHITWSSTSTTAALFRIFRDGAFIKSVSAGDRSYRDYSGTANKEYVYSIEAVTNMEDKSTWGSDEGKRKLKKPTNLSASDATYEDKIVISWDDNSALEHGYLITRLGTRIVGSYDTPDRANGVAISGNYAFVADYTSGLQVIDITNPTSPTFAGSCDTPHEALNVAISGNYAYVADRWSGLQVIDINDPANPDSVGSYDTGNAMDVAISGNYAFVADSPAGLQVIDITNPASPSFAGSCSTGSAGGLTISGNYAYVAAYSSGLQVINIANPASPTIAGSCSTAYAQDIAVSGNYAYVADYSSGLKVIDITNPASPTIAGSCSTGFAVGVTISGNYAYVAAASAGLQVVDITNPASPTLAGSYETPDIASGVAVSGNYAFIADNESGLQVFDIVNGMTASVGPNRTSYVDDEAMSGITYTYTVCAFDSLGEATGYSIKAEDPGSRVLLAPTNVRADKGTSETEIEITWSDNSNAEDGYYIYRDSAPLPYDTTLDNVTSYIDETPVLGETHVYVVRAFDSVGESEAASDSGYTTIQAPTSVNASDSYEDRIELTWLDPSDLGPEFKIYRDSLFITTLETGVTSFTDRPGDPILSVGFYNTPGSATDVAVAGNYAYVADLDSGLQVIDISDPASPTLAGSYDTAGDAIGVAITGNYAYVAAMASGLLVFDIRDPAFPDLIGSYVTSNWAMDVAVTGNYAYVACAHDSLMVIDISTPSAPIRVGAYDTQGVDVSVIVADNIAYVADNNAGLQIISVSDPTSPSFLGVYDTPGSATGVAIADTIAYVADYDSGLQIISVSDPTNPSRLGTYNTPSLAFSVAIVAHYAYVADEYAGLQIIDVSDPANPSLLGTYNTPGYALGVTIGGKYAYIADESSGLQILTTVVPEQTYEYYVQAHHDVLFADSDPGYGSIYIPEPPELEETEMENNQKLLASDGAPDDYFAQRLAISGDWAIIGKSGFAIDDRAYIFERNSNGTWTETSILRPGDEFSDHFGEAVDISGTLAIVGASQDVNDGYITGSAYIFEKGEGGAWVEMQELLPPGTPLDNHGDFFGSSVAISGHRAIVGQYFSDELGSASGAAYLFEQDANGNWMQQQKLLASDGAAGDHFGYYLKISGDWAGMNGGGFTYLFKRNADGTWGEPHTLVANARSETQKLGLSVTQIDINGDRLIAGDYNDDSNGINSGAAYIFELDPSGMWTQTQKILASDGEDHDWFGVNVTMSGDRILVGTNYDAGPANTKCSGSAYVFERDADGTWLETRKLLLCDPNYFVFGKEVDLSRDQAIMNAMDYDKIGAAYIVDLAASAYGVSATDGTLKSRVRITWDDRSRNERGFRIYRDGEAIASVEPNVEVYEDFDAEPGRTYEYSVATLKSDLSEELRRVSDFGWRSANGNITGRISTRGGAAAESISVHIEPLPTKALLFDGTGGHIIVADKEGAFAFTRETSYTIETWVKFTGDGGTGAGDGTMIAKAYPEGAADRYPFSLGNMRSTEPGRIYYKMTDGVTPVEVTSDGTGFNDNRWHHIACVHNAKQDELRLYVDGELQGVETYTGLGLGYIANTKPLCFGAGADAGSWFGGQLDEIRLWNVVRSAKQIQDYKDKQLAGNEIGLVAYWPLDEGSLDENNNIGGNAAIRDIAAGNHYGTFEGGVYWTESGDLHDIYPITDSEGNYILSGIRYGTQTTFKVRPTDGDRQFDPAYRVVTLSTEDPIENQVNFTDISSFTVSGVVRYAGTDCPAADVQILVDTQPSGVTDKNGKFAVSVDYEGEESHIIKPLFEDHFFKPQSCTLTVHHDTLHVDSTGVTFTDMTTRALSGQVGGGCGRSIGDVVVTIRSENNCLLRTDILTSGASTYSMSLPPQAYLVTAAVVEDSIPPGLNNADVVEFFQRLGERRVDLTDTTATLDFVYHAPIVVTISGMESFVTCDELTYDGRTLAEDLPVIPQETILELVITVEEDYGTSGTCLLDSGTVTIYDEIADWADHPFVMQVRDGVAGVLDTQGQFVPNYRTAAVSPSLVVGRTDEQGNDRSFQKYFRAVANVEGRSPVTSTQWALVTGHIAPEGADFVTMTTAPMPFYILRDPPGDKSYAYLEKGYRSSATTEFDMESWTTNEGGEIRNLKTGISIGFSSSKIGIFGHFFTAPWADEMSLMFELQYDSQYRFTEHETIDENGATVVTTEIDELFSTSPDDLFTGGKGDIFVGAGLNYIFSEVGILEVDDECQVVPDESVGFEPNGFETIFAYSEQYISDVLIPELESKVEYYQGIPDPDSVLIFEEMADGWRNMLLENENWKWNAQVKENRSFSAGADYSYSFTTDTTVTYRKSTTLFKDEESDKGAYTNLFGAFDFEWLDVDFYHTSEVLELTDTTGTQSESVGYVLSDDDMGDHFTVDIKEDTHYPSPVFDVRAGASSCPYEPWPDPNGTDRMYKRDNPWIEAVPSRVDDVQPGQAAVFTLNLDNHSETQEPRLYALRLLTESNPCGAIVKVAGEPIMNGMQQYFIAHGEEAQHALLTVERGPTEYGCGTEYGRLAVILYPPCEYALWEDGAPLSLVDTAYFSVTFEDYGPLSFGTPEPADGELSFGEDISITFNETIDCESVDTSSTVMLMYFDQPDSGHAIDIHTTCDGKTIVLKPQADPSDLEGRRLQARVSAIKDPEGNTMTGEVTWEFDYRKSRFTWSELQLARELPYLNPGAVTAELVNGTGETVTYTIAPPDSNWFTVSPMSGTLQPGGMHSILLDIRDDLALGTYETQVTATTEGAEPEAAVLDVYLTVTCNEPAWAINPSNFEHSMNMIVQLDIEGTISTDGNDMVAAFVGNQLRGLADIDSIYGLPQPFVAFLTVYSNRDSSETVRFQVWDDDQCKLYNATEESYKFVKNATHGSPGAPDTLTAIEGVVDGVCTIAVNEGWTWISTNVSSADMSVNTILSDLTPANGDIIKSLSAFSQFDDISGWSPGIVDLDNVSGYLIRLTESGTIYHAGDQVDPPFTIPLSQYWNWISYLPNEPYPLSHALGDLGDIAVTGDVIKSQDAFAEYMSPNWYGSLTMLEPGKGYKLHLSGADPGSFDYPDSAASQAPPVTVAAIKDEVSPAEGTPSWSVNHHQYQHNMTVTAVLSIEGRESIDESDMLGAFFGDECRGVAKPIYVEGTRRYEIFLVVCSNESAGEPITLRAFDADVGLVLDVAEKLTFEADKVEGSVRDPLVFTTETANDGDVVPAVFALGQNYPNPFNPTTTIGYDVPTGGGRVTLCIYDVAGRLVRTLVDGEETAGRKTATWNSRSNRGQQVATGVYFYRMTAPGFEQTRKMVLMK